MYCDCHIHMALDGADWKAALARHKSAPDETFIRRTLEHYRDLGFTFLRDGGDRWGAGEFAARIAAEYGIRYRTPCFPIYKRGHYGSFIGRGYETLDEFRALVAEVKARGGQFVKIMISGIMDFDRFGVLSEPGMDPGEIRQVISAAKAMGMSVMAHANGAETVRAAAEAGVDTVEHGAYLNRDALQACADNGVIWVPTLSAIGNLRGKGRFSEPDVERILASAMENVALYASMGGLIAPGTDAGAWAVPHGSLTEYALLKECLGSGWGTLLDRGIRALEARF